MKPTTPAQKRTAESKMFTALCTEHGYMFSDTLPSKDKNMRLMIRDGVNTTIKPAYVVRLAVPTDSFLGQKITALRKERDPRTSKSAVARAKARAKATAK